MQQNTRSTALRIREAGLKDLSDMQRLECMCFDIEAFSKFQLRYLVTTPTGISLAAEIDGKFAGFIIGIINKNRYGTYGRIYTLDVDTSFRGKGTGTELTSALLERFKASGCEKCFLEVREDNDSAIALYHKLGFQNKHIIPHYYAEGIHAIKMRKDL